MKAKLILLLLFLSIATYSQNKNRALIIGVSDYKELPKNLQLQYADDDAVEFYNFIRSQAIGVIDSTDIKLLLNEKATAAQIYSALDELIDVSKPNDKVIIYFSGHGDIETKTVRQRGFLLAHDSPRAGYQVGGTVKLSDLQDYLETLVTTNKARVILITDACRSGKLAGGEAGATQTTAALHEQWGSITKILSSQAGELSAESNAWGTGHGVFTYNLIHGLWGLADLDKDGWVSLTELNIYLSTEVPKATFDSQHPVISGNLGAKMSRVDKVKVAELNAKSNSNNLDASVMLASNKGTFTNLDTASKRIYNNFNSAVERGDLLLPEKGNAFGLFRHLSSLNATNTPFINDMKRVLVANLEEDAQKILNRHMKQDRSIKNDEYTLARKELDSALSIVPKNYPRYNSMAAKGLFLKADILACTCSPGDVTDDDAKRAMAILNEAIALDADMPYLYNSLGSTYFFLENYDSALANYEKANAMAPAWVYPINNMGSLYLELKNYDKALHFFKESIKLAPDQSWTYDRVATTYFRMGEPDNVMNAANEWAVADSSKATSNYLLIDYGRRYLENDEPETGNADRFFENALAIDSSVQTLVPLVEAYLESKYWRDYYDYGKVQEYMDKMYQLDSTNTDVLILMGTPWIEGEPDYAREFFDRAIKLKPNDAALFKKLGIAYLIRRKFDKAIKYYTTAIKLDPTSASTFMDLGSAYFMEKGYDKAIENYNKGIKLAPWNIDWNRDLGTAYFVKKDYKKAIEYFNKIIQLDHVAGYASFYLGKSYLKMKEYDKSIEYFSKAIVDWGALPSEGYSELSEAYFKKGEKAKGAFYKARSIWELELEGTKKFWQWLERAAKAGYDISNDPFCQTLKKEEQYKKLLELYQPTLKTSLDYGYGPSDAPTVTVGTQTWFGKNLNVDRFANGDLIPEVKSTVEWESANEKKQPAWCYYNNDPANGRIYGKLYNWYAVNDPRGLAPEGWHVPSDAEWTILTNFLGGASTAGTSLKSTYLWEDNGNGNNQSGIAGLPGGERNNDGAFSDLGKYGHFWSSSEYSTNEARIRYLYYKDGIVNWDGSYKSRGFSVRCLKELYQPTQPTVKTSLDHGYGPFDAPTVTVGTQTWLGKNLNVDQFANGDLIPEVKTSDEWESAKKNKQPAWCYYMNDPANGSIYGKLYNWYAVNDPRGLAPKGWHVPSDAEWTIITSFLGGDSTAGTSLKSTFLWEGNGNGNNQSGIAGLPGGHRGSLFGNLGWNGNWWSSSEFNTYTAWYRNLGENGNVYRSFDYKGEGRSVRCIMD